MRYGCTGTRHRGLCGSGALQGWRESGGPAVHNDAWRITRFERYERCWWVGQHAPALYASPISSSSWNSACSAAVFLSAAALACLAICNATCAGLVHSFVWYPFPPQ